MAGPFAAPPPTRPAGPPPSAPVAPGGALVRRQERRPAPWWIVVEAAAVALVLAVVGGLVVASDVVVDWREPVAASILLMTPFFVWYVASRVRRRLLALALGYLAMLVVGVGIALGLALMFVPTIAGFAGGVLGPLAGGVAFMLTSRHERAAARPQAAVTPEHWRVDEHGDTDTMPYVLPKDELRRMHDGDSLAG